MGYFKYDRESDYYFSLADVALFNLSQKLLLAKQELQRQRVAKVVEVIIPPPAKAAGRPTSYNWNTILTEYKHLNDPPLKPFCRLHGISPKLLRYHLRKIKKPNLLK